MGSFQPGYPSIEALELICSREDFPFNDDPILAKGKITAKMAPQAKNFGVFDVNRR